MNIRFLKHKVINDTTKQSARVTYSLDNRTDGRKCVTIYAKEYGAQLSKVVDPKLVSNQTDTMTDYFCKDTVRLFEDHPLYAAARKRANENLGVFEGEPKEVTCSHAGKMSQAMTVPEARAMIPYIDMLHRFGVKAICVH